jgi:CBS-domain-containing membrane protein
MGTRVKKVNKENTVSVLLERREDAVSLESKVLKVSQVLKVFQVSLDYQVLLEPQDVMAVVEKRVSQVQQDLKVQKEILLFSDNKVHQVDVVDKALKDLQDVEVPKVNEVYLVLLQLVN